MSNLAAFTQGFVLGLAMFVASGPKDVLILRETLIGQSSLKLITIAVGSDIILIALGMLGLSALLQQAPTLQTAALSLGIALLVLHAVQAGASAIKGTYAANAAGSSSPGPDGLRQVVWVSLFNPAAWLDTVLVIGAVGAALAAPMKYSFAAGAVSASLTWFTIWVFGARSFRRWMGAPYTWRMLDAAVAVAMIAMAAFISYGLFH